MFLKIHEPLRAQRMTREKLIRAFSITSAVALCFTALWFTHRARANSFEVAVASHTVRNLGSAVIR